MDQWLYDVHDAHARTHRRMRNIVGRARLDMIDDSGFAQTHQLELLPGELRSGVQRMGGFGHGSVPLPNASGIVIFQGGDRGFGTLIGVEDPRYRNRGYKGGEAHFSMVDGAGADGTGGTMRKLAEGLLGWVHNLFGKTINIGTQADTTTIALTSGQTITITGDTVTITGQTGDVVVNGISLVNHKHDGVTPGNGQTGKPVGG